MRYPSLIFLQMLVQQFTIEGCQLIQYLNLAVVPLGPLLRYIQAGQIEHLFRWANTLFLFVALSRQTLMFQNVPDPVQLILLFDTSTMP